MNRMVWVQILDKAICISLYANSLWKVMNLSLLPLTIGEIADETRIFSLVGELPSCRSWSNYILGSADIVECVFDYFLVHINAHIHTHTHILTHIIYIYIYTYIYCHPQTDCFIVSQLCWVSKHAGRFKLVLKPAQRYIRFSIIPLSHQSIYVSSGIIRHYVLAFICLHFALPDTRVLNSLEELCIFIGLVLFLPWLFGDRRTHPRKRSMPRNWLRYFPISCS